MVLKKKNPDLPSVGSNDADEVARSGNTEASERSGTASPPSDFDASLGRITSDFIPPRRSTKEGPDIFTLNKQYHTAAAPARGHHAAPLTTQGYLTQTENFSSVDQSTNFMDHQRANYNPGSALRGSSSSSNDRFRSNRFRPRRGTQTTRSSFVSIFMSKRSSVQSGSTEETIDEEYELNWGKVGTWFLIFIIFGVMAAFLLISVPYIVTMATAVEFVNTAMDPEEAELRYQAMQTFVTASGLTGLTDLMNKTSSQHYALQWLSATDPARLVSGDPKLLIRYAMATLYYSIHPEIALAHSKGEQRRLVSSGRSEYDGWMTKKDCCRWDGMQCENGNAMTLDLASKQLRGSIPSELAALSTLRHVNMSGSVLTGTAPEWLFALPSIETIDLSHNELSGTLPLSISSAVNLRDINLGGNTKLKGSIPDMSRLTQLTAIDLSQNKFEGRIPPSLMKLSGLESIRLERNLLTGPIPSELKSWSGLEILALGHNELNGGIPDIFAGFHQLTEIRLQKNLLEHALPPSLGNLTKLKIVMMDGNRLAGSIPPSWMDMVNLEELLLHKNELTGSIPTKIGSLTHVKNLWLSQNHLTGVLPSELGLLTVLDALYLYDNPLMGTVPTDLGLLVELEALRLDKTELSGVMPQEVCALKEVSQLVVVKSQCRNLRCLCCTKCA